ncbi:uncharacterized protein RCC_01254 [Ramularia collo-cygni]|uniref:AB hydrolase-1 domain-containing protein n=1 Tax=Ramularia collo-cygni TaxID=112498 RepID=A0A2D3US40_9PEZI|nr:uncharacterized protein RCC_01254 [Ramularia collo-cygni]CZT15390.1 uncharacterized protein RCC_01254 [Ramularia collo-cygni]
MESVIQCFDIHEHIINASHIRSYPCSSRDEFKPLKLHVKQYVPNDHEDLGSDAVTIIAASGIGFPKECYEAFFADIFKRCKKQGIKIRAFWIADQVTTASSGILNAGDLGTSLSWWDHSRDLLHLINVFSEQMLRPLIGLGHSLGGTQLAYLSTLHPALFNSLILIEPPIYPTMERKHGVAHARLMLRRKTEWTSREQAEKSMRKAPYFKKWNPFALARYFQFALQDLPPSAENPGAVRLATSKHLEVAHIFRLNDQGLGLQGLESLPPKDRKTIPDIDPSASENAPLYSPWTREMFFRLPNLRPWVLYIDGDSTTTSSSPEMAKQRLKNTGTDIGGSGGEKMGTVKQVVINGAQHTMPLDEHMGEVAEAASGFIVAEMKRWQQEGTMVAWVEDGDGRIPTPPRQDERFLRTVEDYEELAKKFAKSKL